MMGWDDFSLGSPGFGWRWQRRLRHLQQKELPPRGSDGPHLSHDRLPGSALARGEAWATREQEREEHRKEFHGVNGSGFSVILQTKSQ